MEKITLILFFFFCFVFLAILVGVYFYNREIDCELSEWSSCSATCGGGIQTRTVKTLPKNGGKQCGDLSQTCNTFACTTPTPTPTQTPTPTPSTPSTPPVSQDGCNAEKPGVVPQIPNYNISIVETTFRPGVDGYGSQRDYNLGQDIIKIIDGDINTLWNPFYYDNPADKPRHPVNFATMFSGDTTQQCILKFNFSKKYTITKIEITSGVYIPAVKDQNGNYVCTYNDMTLKNNMCIQDWENAEITFNNINQTKMSILNDKIMGYTAGNTSGIGMVVNTINVPVGVCTDSLLMKFNNSGRLRDIKFYGY